MTAMNFNTTNSTFRHLLGNGVTYRVPPFQRDYSWDEDEWDDLWQDIQALFQDGGEPAHYMGYLVLQTSDARRHSIIDGQQRITTISVMILAALATLQGLADVDIDAERNLRRKEQLRSSYIGFVDPVSLVAHSKLELNRHNDRFYQTYLVPMARIPQRGLTASEHLLRKAFQWFQERLSRDFGSESDSGERIAAFVDSLVDKLFFTVITVTDELNAFKVFETLNSRGVRLSATDLLKNALFSLLDSVDAHAAEVKCMEDLWEQIVGCLGSESFPEFLRVYWNSRNKLVRKSDLFKTIRRAVITREEAFALLRALDLNAAVYAALRDPQDNMWNHEERAALQQLLMFSVRQPLAMLLACHERFFDSDRPAFTSILRAVAVVSFRYNVICNLQTHEQESLYNSIARKVSDGTYTTRSDVIGALRDVYPSDVTFNAAFTDKELRTTNHRNKKVVRYILFEIEQQRSGQDFDLESASYSIEHILPEHPSEVWNHIDEAKQERLIYRLGNMTPLETGKNRDLGNGAYAAKQAVYATSNFQITRGVADNYDSWDERKVESHQRALADIATSIWRIDLGGGG